MEAHDLSLRGTKLGSSHWRPPMKKLQSLYADPDRLVVHACLACLAFLPVLLVY